MGISVGVCVSIYAHLCIYVYYMFMYKDVDICLYVNQYVYACKTNNNTGVRT